MGVFEILILGEILKFGWTRKEVVIYTCFLLCGKLGAAVLTYSGFDLGGCCCTAGAGTTRLKLLKLAVGVGTGCAWCGRRLRRDLVKEESLEED